MVSGISIFASKTDWQLWGRSGEWAGSHTLFIRSTPSFQWSFAWFLARRILVCKEHRLFRLKTSTRMPTVHKQMLLIFGEFLCATAKSGNAWEKVNECSYQGRDGVQDYVGCNDHSSANLFFGSTLWSLGPWYSMLGRTAFAIRKKQQLCGWVWLTPLLSRPMLPYHGINKGDVKTTESHWILCCIRGYFDLRPCLSSTDLAKKKVKMKIITIKNSISWV